MAEHRKSHNKEQIEGRIYHSVAGSYQVLTEVGSFSCKPRGRLRLAGTPPYTGDRVLISLSGDGSGVIDQILPRVSLMDRPAIANVDQIIVVLAPEPKPNYLLIDRILVAAENQNLKCILVLNKSDLGIDTVDYLDAYRLIGYPLFIGSVTEQSGFEGLFEACKGHISVLAGQSGMGKSSLINYLCPAEDLATNEISEKRGFGRHTTRTVSLLELPGGGLLADTPGFNNIHLASIASERLDAHFPEMYPFLGKCRFMSCIHQNEPNCAVIEAVKNGDIAENRYKSYLAILAELQDIERNKYQ